MSRSGFAVATVALTASLLSACGSSAPETGTSETITEGTAQIATPEELMEADRAFAGDVAERGATGWAAWFDAEGQMVAGDGVFTGPDAVLVVMVPLLDESDRTLVWEPTEAYLAESGEMGFTVGTYRIAPKDPAIDETYSSGVYLTVWKRQADGAWKVFRDIGSPASPVEE